MKKALVLISIILLLTACAEKVDYTMYLNGVRQTDISDMENQSYAYIMQVIENGSLDSVYKDHTDILCTEIFYAMQCHECLLAGVPNAVLWVRFGGYDLKGEFLSKTYGIPIGGQSDGMLLEWYTVYEGDAGSYISFEKINRMIIDYWKE